MRYLAFFLLLASAAVAQNTVVRPKVIDDVLVNPGMGIQTFQRFNRQAIYPGLRWSEVGPEKPVADEANVNFPPASVAYIRWFWWQLEPEQGKYRWDVIDSALDEARRHGQTLDFRLMPYDQGNPLPEWFQKSGAKRANKPEDRQDGKVWIPDSADPLYIQLWSAVVVKAGERYDGHPYVDAVDISTFGYWGEGWGPHPPDWATQKLLTDLYFDAFPRTPLLMNFDVLKTLVYATGRGAGWRLDCWGDMGRPGRNFAHMVDRYPQYLAHGTLQEVWRGAPVSLETCGTPGSWARQADYDLKYVLDEALRWHVSTVNIKSTAIPDKWKKDFEEFQKKLGYRFALRRLEYPAKVKAGYMMPVQSWWQNTGVAPVYREYSLAVQFSSPAGSATVRVPVDVRKWLPGEIVWDGTLPVDEALKPGAYRVRVALLDPRTGQPAIQLAIEGRQPDGWYDLGAITVE